ncbi:M23 family metallopeptidase [Streptomyces sp. NBC_01481]|uniref:M23 family metallopeptidase n=1 Tax=Streptomyces sp. NBC_01481 TaxID=2975869 RepID=UPI00225023C9|nr:M23 family metallopeptidase [Streptomyces sp. NBC_01481]MCX4583696.1 M23 family metallopeptidase [Streptomyces sp. NBC_01481]
MSKRVINHRLRPSVLRNRGTVVAAGLGAVMVVGAGAGVASATAGKAAATTPAAAVAVQADVQAKAAATAKAAAAAKAAANAKALKAAAKAKAAKAAAVKAAAAKAAKAKAAKKVGWVKPVARYTLSASFNQGGAMWSHKHSGQDFAVPVGTVVKATHGGVVVKAGPNGGGDGSAYGNAIVIKHANGTYSQYAHLSKINVFVGKHVKTGQTIARSGNTGNSSGPHLHFEIRTTPNYGSAVNPMAFLRAEGVSI